MFKIPTLIILCSSMLFSNCKDKIESEASTVEKEILPDLYVGDALPYDLDKPAQVHQLERDLFEISGLAYYPDQEFLFAVNDEKGRIYFIGTEGGRIGGHINFHRANDYEGIAYHDNHVYIVESNGDITVIDANRAEKIDGYKTKLSRKNDIEGISYNPATSTFLLAAKGSGSLNGKTKKKKSIYSLDPKSKTVSETPFFTVNLGKEIKKLGSAESPNNSNISNYQMIRANKFSPSGIAVHPISTNIYVLSSRGKLLTVFDQKGKLLGVHFLDEKVHSQPEGICFGPDNTLYISNEGRAGRATLLSYKYKK